MMRLLIVDDERITLNTLQNYVRWDEWGIDEVEASRNGHAALESARLHPPDILLCDIRMPKMDGIELATAIRAGWPDCRIIFLSGHSDKEYLKSAISLQAISYLEKPLNFEEIGRVVRQTVALCQQDKQQKKNYEILLQAADRSLHLRMENLILGLVHGGVSVSGIAENEEEQDIQLIQPTDSMKLHIACVLVNGASESSFEEGQLCVRAITAVLRTWMEKNRPSAWCASDGMDRVIWLERHGADECTQGCGSPLPAQELLYHLHGKGEESCSVSIGFGRPVADLGSLPDAYAEACRLADTQFYLGPWKVYQEECHPTALSVPSLPIAKFREAIRSADLSSACEVIDRLQEEAMQCMDPDQARVKNMFFALFMQIYEVETENELRMAVRESQMSGNVQQPLSIREPLAGKATEDPIESDRQYLWQLVERARFLSTLVSLVKSAIREVISDRVVGEKPNKHILEIQRYIHENIANCSLGNQSIATHMFFTQSYLCVLFRKHTGETLNEYITEVRMEKAKDYLRNTRLKLFEIAERIGFNDPNYFSAAFRKHTGCTPSEYRGECGR